MNDLSHWKRPAQWAGIILVGFVAVLGGLFALAQTGTGKSLLSSGLSTLLSGPERKVSFGAIEGLVPFKMRIDRIEAADANGPLLRVENLSLRLSALPILLGRLHLDYLDISELNLVRLPPQAEDEKAGKLEIPSFLREKWPVRIERLLIRDLRLGEAISGQSALFRIEAGMKEAGSGKGRRTFLHLERTDSGPETRADISIVVEGSPANLRVNALFREEEGGVAAAMLGLGPGPLSLEMRGRGPVDDWKGTIQGNAGPYGSITTQLAHKSGKETTLTLDGKVELAESLLPRKMGPIVGGSNFFRLNLISSKSRFHIEEAMFYGKGYRGLLSGRLNRETEAMEGQWQFVMENLQVLEEYAGTLSGELHANGTLTGKLRRPEGTASVVLKKIHGSGVLAEEVRTDVKLEPLQELVSPALGFRLTGNTVATGLSVTSREPVARSAMQWSVELEAPVPHETVKLRIQAGDEPNNLHLSASIDTARKSGSLEGSLRIEDLKDISLYTGNEIPGKPALKMDFSGSLSEGSGSGRFEGAISAIEDANTPISGLFSPETKFSGEFEIKEALVSLSAFQVENPHLTFGAHGAANTAGGRMNGEWHLKVPRIEEPAKRSGLNATGAVEARGAASGNIESLEHAVTITGSDLVIEGRELPRITANLKAREVPGNPSGDLKLEVSRDGERLSISTDFALSGESLHLTSLKVGAPGGDLNGDFSVDFQKNTAQGKLEGGFSNLAALGRLTGEPLTGSAKLRMNVTKREKDFVIQANLAGTDLSTRLGTVKQLTLSADVSDVPNAPKGKLNLDVRDFEGAGTALHTLSLKMSGSEKGLEFESSGKGQYQEDFNFQTRGDVTRAKDSDQLRVSLLSGRFGDHPFRLIEPISIRRSDERVSIDKLSVGIGKGRLTVSGRFDTKGISLNADFDKMPLGAPASFGTARFSAIAAGSLKVEGPSASPSISLNGRLSNIRPYEQLTEAQQPPPLDFEIRLSGGRIKATAQMQGSNAENVKAVLSAPAEFSLVPFAFSLPPEGGLEGEIEGKSNLARLSSLVPLRGHELSGPATGRFTLEGTVGAPRVGGSLRVERGWYQNLDYGSVLKDLTIEVSAVGQRLEIEKMRATDGDKGSLTAEGSVNIDPERNFPVDIKINLSNMTLIRRHDVTGTIDGSITVAGSADKMAIGGKLEVKSAEVLLKSTPPRAVVQLEVIEVSPGKAATEPRAEQEAPSAPGPEIDLKVNIPGNVFVRGRGLDSEWRGDLGITGQTGKQAITGNLNTVRGTFDFLGKRFTVTSGVISFHGAIPFAPTIDVTAESRAKDITARLILQGAASGPDIRLESDPPLPSDEILSRVLFNRTSGNLTPLQALRLADALRSLSGRGHALDFLARTREFLGLGQLEFRETGNGDENDTALGLGKYLTEDVYVDVEKGIGSESGKASVRVEITPKINIEAEAGMDSRQGIGLNWKHDY